MSRMRRTYEPEQSASSSVPELRPSSSMAPEFWVALRVSSIPSGNLPALIHSFSAHASRTPAECNSDKAPDRRERPEAQHRGIGRD
jgi:hypothetical protein